MINTMVKVVKIVVGNTAKTNSNSNADFTYANTLEDVKGAISLNQGYAREIEVHFVENFELCEKVMKWMVVSGNLHSVKIDTEDEEIKNMLNKFIKVYF